MRFEVSFKEVQEFIVTSYKIHVGIKNLALDSIKINYFISLVLNVKEVKSDKITFQYNSNQFYNLLIKGVHFFIKKKLEKLPVTWDISTKELVIDLRQIKDLELFLRLSSLSELHFKDDALVVVVLLNPKS
jgi:uncharacterized protein YijF (DUF1287 family)